jgi:hypothetical protein
MQIKLLAAATGRRSSSQYLQAKSLQVKQSG